MWSVTVFHNVSALTVSESPFIKCKLFIVRHMERCHSTIPWLQDRLCVQMTENTFMVQHMDVEFSWNIFKQEAKILNIQIRKWKSDHIRIRELWLSTAQWITLFLQQVLAEGRRLQNV